MNQFPYDLTGPIGTAATLGLIVLQSDETIENDFRRLFPANDVAIHASRVRSGTDLTVDMIADMEDALPVAARLLPPADFDVVAYGCTSGTAQIGVERVAQLVGQACRTSAVTNPLSAALAAFTDLGTRRIGLVSPYAPEIVAPLRTAFEAAGVEVHAALSFGERVEARVARIDPASISRAAEEVARSPGLDGIFLSCTNLRTLDIIDALESRLGIPILSSNQVLAWHMAQLAGAAPITAVGRLMQPRAAIIPDTAAMTAAGLPAR